VIRISNNIQDMLQGLLAEMRAAFTGFIDDNFSYLREPSYGLDEEIKVMLGRGEITREQYDQLNRKLKFSTLARGDLELLRRQARKQAYQQARASTGFHEQEVAGELDRLFIQIVSLEDSRQEAQQAKQRVEADINRIQEHAKSAEDMASKALPDENEARAMLEIRQNMLERLRRLEAHQRSLEQSIQRLEVLQGELYAHEAELKVQRAQASLARQEYRARQSLQAQKELNRHELPVQPGSAD
jgi:chromosome segregation ATPase